MDLRPLTVKNLPYDSTGKLVNMTGVGTVSGVRNPRQMQLMMKFSFQEGAGARREIGAGALLVVGAPAPEVWGRVESTWLRK